MAGKPRELDGLAALLAEVEAQWDRRCVACGEAPRRLGLMACEACWDALQPKAKQVTT